MGGAQPGFELSALLLRECTNEDWRFHGHYCNSSLTTSPEDALGREPQLHRTFMTHAYYQPQCRCRNRHSPTQGRSRQRGPQVLQTEILPALFMYVHDNRLVT